MQKAMANVRGKWGTTMLLLIVVLTLRLGVGKRLRKDPAGGVSSHSVGSMGIHLLSVSSAPSKAMARKLVLAQMLQC